MKTINAILSRQGITFATLLLVFFAAGCDALNNEEPEVATLTQEDLEAASSILAQSLSDQNEGMMANLNDMTADIGTSDISYASRRFGSNPALRPCRGENKEFEKTFDETTGVHTVHYKRYLENDICIKDVEVFLNYTFTDAEGKFLAAPRTEQDLVSEIAFTGTRVGSGSFVHPRGSRSIEFNQSGEWNLTGLQTEVASLSGSQVNDGSFEYEFMRPDSTGQPVSITSSGVYHLEFSTVDVTISQTAGENEDLETQITGTMQYVMTMEKTINGNTEQKEIEGIIELEGNGRALLRFLGLRKIYRVTLQDGVVTETDGETSGDG